MAPNGQMDMRSLTAILPDTSSANHGSSGETRQYKARIQLVSSKQTPILPSMEFGQRGESPCGLGSEQALAILRRRGLPQSP